MRDDVHTTDVFYKKRETALKGRLAKILICLKINAAILLP